MKNMTLWIKRLKGIEKEETNIQLQLCENWLDKWRYTKVFVKSFNKPFINYLIVFLNCFGYNEDLYIAYLENEIIGCFTLRPQSRRIMYLYDFAILPKYRGKGISHQLLNIIYNICLNDNKKKLCLYLKKGNYIAFNLYIKEGFQEYCEKSHL